MDCQTNGVAPIFKRRGAEGVLQLSGNQTVILSLSGKAYVKVAVKHDASWAPSTGGFPGTRKEPLHCWASVIPRMSWKT